MIEPFIKYLHSEKRCSPHTAAAYQRDLLQLSDFLSSTFEIQDYQQVAHVHLREWVVALTEQDLSPASVNRKIATLKSFFKFLLKRDYLKTNPAANLTALKSKKRLPTFVQETEMSALLDAFTFDSDFSGLRDQLLIELLYGTGIRLAELIGLKETDINSYDQTIRVLGKRDKERILPINNPLILQIKGYLQAKREEGLASAYLLVTNSGKPLYPMFIYRKINHYLSLITTQSKKSPHVLRHTFATHLLNKGADLNAVKDLLGHTSLAATQVYTHNSIEKLKEAFNQAHPKA